MKLLDIKSDVRTIGEQETLDFQLDTGPQAFKTLISNIYPNPIKAINRELSTNAYDSHVEAGCPDKPFYVHMPTYNDGTYYIRDFGTGLSPENIKNIYVFFFRSDKTGDNKKVGCFGLGSKSPLAYADSFIVESYYNGKKIVMVPYIAEDYTPKLNYLTPKEGIDTDEPNGVKISINVEKKDINAWVNEATKIYSSFRVKPDCNLKLYYTEPVYAKDFDFTTHYSTNWSTKQSYAVMGNVSYPLVSYEGMSVLSRNLILETGLSFEFELGSLSLTPSREALHYDPLTINNIDIALTKFTKKGQEFIVKTLKPYKNLFDLKCQLSSFTFNSVLRIIIESGIMDDTKIGEYTIKEIRNLRAEHAYTGFTGCRIAKYEMGKRCGKRRNRYLRIEKNVIIVWDDVKKSGPTLLEYTENNTDITAYLITPTKEFTTVGQTEQAILDKLGLKEFVKASSLPKPTKVYTNYRARATGMVKKFSRGCTSSSYLEYCWKDVPAANVDEGYYVVTSSNYVVYNKENKHPSFISSLVEYVDPKAEMPIYGIGKLSIKLFPNLKPLLDPKFLEDFLPKYFKKAYGCGNRQDLENYKQANMYNLMGMKNSVSVSGVMGKFLTSAERGKNIKYEYTDSNFFTRFGYDTKDYFTKAVNEKDLNLIKAKYPFLFGSFPTNVHINVAHRTNYVNLVDKGKFE